MTRSRYILARLAQAFGLSFQGRHASNAAAELHLLREAEEILGRLCWQDLEELEDLSVEYWNLRKLSKEFTSLSAEIERANSLLQQSHDERAGLLEKVVDSTKDLVAQREDLIEKSERLNSERDAIVREARAVKRRHDGLKAKLEVLAGEGVENPGQLTGTQSEIEDLKRRFALLKNRRNELTARIQDLDETIEKLDETIESRRKDLRDEALGSYQSIGKANRDISSCRSELGVVEKEMASLFCEIGRYVAINADHENCRRATRKHRGLIHQMTALRESVAMNNHLAGRTPSPYPS
jgi:predicted  nucleic acid-binding Zn-ribbon protein